MDSSLTRGQRAEGNCGIMDWYGPDSSSDEEMQVTHPPPSSDELGAGNGRGIGSLGDMGNAGSNPREETRNRHLDGHLEASRDGANKRQRSSGADREIDCEMEGLAAERKALERNVREVSARVRDEGRGVQD